MLELLLDMLLVDELELLIRLLELLLDALLVDELTLLALLFDLLLLTELLDALLLLTELLDNPLLGDAVPPTTVSRPQPPSKTSRSNSWPKMRPALPGAFDICAHGVSFTLLLLQLVMAQLLIF